MQRIHDGSEDFRLDKDDGVGDSEQNCIREVGCLMARRMEMSLWLMFALIVLAIYYVLLTACDLGVRPLFGSGRCDYAAPWRAAGLRDEQDRERALRARLHEAALRLARLPLCQAPAKRPESPQPAPGPRRAENGEGLKIPERMDDLQGCWQSDRGDIQVTTDDEERKPTGKIRACLCFSRNGQGRARMTFTDGDRCEAPLSVQIGTGELVMRHARIPCARHGSMVPAKIVCRRRDGEEDAVCDTENLGRVRDRLAGEKYHKVDSAYCGWTP